MLGRKSPVPSLELGEAERLTPPRRSGLLRRGVFAFVCGVRSRAAPHVGEVS